MISQGSWIVKQSVGRKACLVGQALEMNYFQGKNYMEVNMQKFHPMKLLNGNNSKDLSTKQNFQSISNLFISCVCDAYPQLGIDIGSSTVARGVVSLVLGYLNNLVIEMAFLIQVNQHYPSNTSLKFDCLPRYWMFQTNEIWTPPSLSVYKSWSSYIVFAYYEDIAHSINGMNMFYDKPSYERELHDDDACKPIWIFREIHQKSCQKSFLELVGSTI